MSRRIFPFAVLLLAGLLAGADTAQAWRGRVVQFIATELPGRREITVGIITGVIGNKASEWLDLGVSGAAAAILPSPKPSEQPKQESQAKQESQKPPEASKSKIAEVLKKDAAPAAKLNPDSIGRVPATCLYTSTNCSSLERQLRALSSTDWQKQLLQPPQQAEVHMQLSSVRVPRTSLVPAPKPEAERCTPGIAVREALRRGAIWDNGVGVAKRDAAAAVECYRIAAQQDNALGAFNLADILLRGEEGVPRDLQTGMKWLEMAAQAGLIPAQSRLGKVYEEEKAFGAARNAVFWYTKAAEGGDAWAQTRLSHFYFDGIGVEANLVRAFEWLNAAASVDYAPAQQAMDQLLPIVFDEADDGRPWGLHAKGLAYERGVKAKSRKIAPDYRKAFVAYREALRQNWQIAGEDMKRLCRQQPGACT